MHSLSASVCPLDGSKAFETHLYSYKFNLKFELFMFKLT